MKSSKRSGRRQLRLTNTPWLILLTAGLLLLTEARAGVAADRPNIVLVVVDDLQWEDLGCAGQPFSQTPNIDRLAAESDITKVTR